MNGHANRPASTPAGLRLRDRVDRVDRVDRPGARPRRRLVQKGARAAVARRPEQCATRYSGSALKVWSTRALAARNRW